MKISIPSPMSAVNFVFAMAIERTFRPVGPYAPEFYSVLDSLDVRTRRIVARDIFLLSTCGYWNVSDSVRISTFVFDALAYLANSEEYADQYAALYDECEALCKELLLEVDRFSGQWKLYRESGDLNHLASKFVRSDAQVVLSPEDFTEYYHITIVICRYFKALQLALHGSPGMFDKFCKLLLSVQDLDTQLDLDNLSKTQKIFFLKMYDRVMLYKNGAIPTPLKAKFYLADEEAG